MQWPPVLPHDPSEHRTPSLQMLMVPQSEYIDLQDPSTHFILFSVLEVQLLSVVERESVQVPDSESK